MPQTQRHQRRARRQTLTKRTTYSRVPTVVLCCVFAPGRAKVVVDRENVLFDHQATSCRASLVRSCFLFGKITHTQKMEGDSEA